MDTLTDKTAEFGASENPHTVRGWLLSSSRVGVWRGVTWPIIIGTIVFRETVRSEYYDELIMNFMSSEVDKDNWFLQDRMNRADCLVMITLLPKTCGPLIYQGLTPLELYLGGGGGWKECVQKQREHMRRIQIQYSTVFFKHHWRNSSPNCVKREKRRDARSHERSGCSE
jgi:hypothetical protein